MASKPLFGQITALRGADRVAAGTVSRPGRCGVLETRLFSVHRHLPFVLLAEPGDDSEFDSESDENQQECRRVEHPSCSECGTDQTDHQVSRTPEPERAPQLKDAGDSDGE